MEIYGFSLGMLQTNCYLVVNESTNEAIVIDAGAAPDALLRKAENYTVKAILLTHAHIDHIAGLTQIRKATGAPVYIHQSEQSWLRDPNLNGSRLWPGVSSETSFADAEHTIVDEQLLSLAGFEITPLHTPGHSPGGLSFLIGQALFCGDALFAGSIGRTDLPGGNYDQLIMSIQDQLLGLDDETQCFPGHGNSTTIGREKQYNPYLTGNLR